MTRAHRVPLFAFLAVCVLSVAIGRAPAQGSTEPRPNFLVIVADDLGFSDLGSFGGEIRTPNLDRLANEGLRFTNFYVSVSCSPTRAMLLSGLDHHLVGLGNMYERTAPNQQGLPGYEGVLSPEVRTIAETLADHGYRTMMAGKWHLGHAPTHIPAAQGFQRSFSLLNAAGSHFDFTGNAEENEESEFVEDERYLRKLPRRYYSSTTFTDKILEYVGDGADAPFFAYLAFQAPHDPLQVPDRWLRTYKGHYDEGWDVARQERLRRMKEIGIVPEAAEAAARLWYIPGFDKLTGLAQVTTARRMEVYAAMVELLDHEVGRLIDELERRGLADNTYVLFFSDNGPESTDKIDSAKKRGSTSSANFYANNYRTDFASWGRHNSYVSYGQPWAQVSATPFNMFKGFLYEGGVRSPLIVWHPELARSGEIDTTSVLHVTDVAPTLLGLAGIPSSEMIGTQKPGAQTGRSWLPVLEASGSKELAARPLGMAIWGARAYRQGRWKALLAPVPFGTGDWQLFDLENDPAERHDLGASHPEVLQRLSAAWDRYAEANNVVLPNRSSFDGLEEILPPRPPVESPGWPPGQEPNWTSPEEDNR